MALRSSISFEAACREVRSRFPTAFRPVGPSAESARGEAALGWASSLPDRPGLHQVVAPAGRSSGSLEMLLALVEETGRRGMRMVWIDPADCLDPPTAFQDAPRHLLWARGGGLGAALRVADAVARDPHFPFVCLDGMIVPTAEWKKVPLPLWYRLQRLVRRQGACLVLWSPPVPVPPAERRWALGGGWSFESLADRWPEELRAALHFDRIESVAPSGQGLRAPRRAAV